MGGLRQPVHRAEDVAEWKRLNSEMAAGNTNALTVLIGRVDSRVAAILPACRNPHRS